MPKPTLLLLASYFKGERFMLQAHARGARLYLLTLEKLLGDKWPREALADVFALPGRGSLDETVRAVSYLARNIKFDGVVALDDFDVEIAASLREHFRFPGMGDTGARFFRDKLAMRQRAKDFGLPVPEFTGVFHHEDVRAFAARVPPPWMNKPRSQASAVGITKVTSEEHLWRLVNEQGDAQSYHVLEQYLPGDVYHVDSLVVGGKVIFSLAHRCGAPPFDVAHGGGIFSTQTLDRDSADAKELRELNEKVLAALGLQYGAAHTEFILGRHDRKFYFLESGARVGGAHIAECIEAASGINLWAEWANIEIDRDAYVLPPVRNDYAGLIITLAKQEHPDWSGYSDPEIVYRAPEANHAGLVIRSSDHHKVESLLESYKERFARDFNAVLPAPKEPGH
ncbi:acetyl-CoA carboxylase biotin carboxylase subunit family protein [Pendulispora albinea]|uniref:ATP-grasp domain-containing protein n=1 Tax=Pendulispora albinea TaxID=2741071 RepID=A0ABZ2M8Y0_9BACT